MGIIGIGGLGTCAIKVRPRQPIPARARVVPALQHNASAPQAQEAWGAGREARRHRNETKIDFLRMAVQRNVLPRR